MSNVVIELENLNLKINDTVLMEDFSLRLSKGERLGITGPSGCGKSTLVKALMKNKFPGKTTFSKFEQAMDSVYSYIPQSSGLLPWFSLNRNLEIYSRGRALFQTVVQRFKLGKVLDNFPHQLSGGEYQRAVLSAAILNRPDVYFVDEPLTELDITNKWDLLSFWSRQVEETKATLLLVSHDIETLLYLCDRVIVLSDKPSTIKNDFAVAEGHPRPLEFLVSENFIASKKQLLHTIGNKNEG